MAPKIVTLILNYRNASDTAECIRSLLRSSYPNHEWVVIDNASADGSADFLRKEFPQITLIENAANLGYAGGNNVGIDYAITRGADYIFILNNDAVLAEPDTLERLVAIGEQDPAATLLAPRVCFFDNPERINSLGTKMDWIRLRPKIGLCGAIDLESDRPLQSVTLIPGSALLFKRNLIEKVGKFDESYFLIHEDADLCYRNLKAGFKNIVVPQATVYHKVSRTLSKYPFLTSYYTTRNFLYLAEAHATWFQKIETGLGVLFFSLKHAIDYLLKMGQREQAKGFFIGIQDFLAHKTGAYQKKVTYR